MSKLTYWDRIMMAITFAESGEAKTAKYILENDSRNEKRSEKTLEKRPALEL